MHFALENARNRCVTHENGVLNEKDPVFVHLDKNPARNASQQNMRHVSDSSEAEP
jgi:hypothetical protein